MLGRLRRQKRSRRAVWASRAAGSARLLGAADQAVLRFLRTRGHDPVTERVMKGLGLAGEYGAVWMSLGAAAAAADPSRRSRWLSGALVAPAAIVANFAVKRTVGRQRPVITEHPPLARAPTKLSFPSAHATSSVAAATAFGRVEPRAKLPLYGLATAICVCRPYLGMHYPSDVVAGAALGALLGRLAPLPPTGNGVDASAFVPPPTVDRESDVPPSGDSRSFDPPVGSVRESERASMSDSSRANASRGSDRNT
jgi:undecaprenyl-diphosphatase